MRCLAPRLARPLLFLLATFAASQPAFAAQVTDVADAVDGDDPFDANIELKFDLLRHSALITRENTQPPEGDPTGDPRTADVKELDYEHLRFRIKPRLEIGVFHDLALFAEWPIVIWDQKSFRYTDGTDETNSTLARDQAPKPSPAVDGWPETAGSGNTRHEISDGKFGFPGKGYNDWRFDHSDNGSFTGYRQGFDNPTFGVRWSPLNNERDDTKPTITLQGDYTAPFFQFMDPTNDEVEDQSKPGPVADGAHKFHVSVAMSKRFLGILDPYFVLDYTLPLASPGGGSLPGYIDNGTGQFGGFTVGAEIIPYEDAKLSQKFAIDLSAFATYYSEGRQYSEIADAVQEMTYTDQYVRTGLRAGIFFRAFQYLFFDVTGTIGTDTEHLLTIEDFGTDGPDDNDEIDLDNPIERNVFFNPALDTVGRRLKLESSLHLGVLVWAGLTF